MRHAAETRGDTRGPRVRRTAPEGTPTTARPLNSGNFHTVLVDCTSRLVYNYDLDGIDCSLQTIGEAGDVDPRVCDACALPFGIRDTDGVYETDQGVGFEWAKDDDANAFTGVQASGGLEMRIVFDTDGTTPLYESVNQPGWQRTIVTFSNWTTDVDGASFVPPACFQ